ncbi:hypothetical protein CFC21_004937, partial [Triticum aestivum]
KSSWPELVGVMATPAATQIALVRPDVAVEVLPPGAPLTPDYNPELAASSSTPTASSPRP